MAVTGVELTWTISVPFCFLQRLYVVNIGNSKLVKLIYTFPQQETVATDSVLSWQNFCRDKHILSRQNLCRYKYLSRNVCHVNSVAIVGSVSWLTKSRCGQRIKYRTRNSETGCSIPSLVSGSTRSQQSSPNISPKTSSNIVSFGLLISSRINC